MFGLFGGTKERTAALIEISSRSIGSALVAFPDAGAPLMPYALRNDISFPGDAPTNLCMVRAVETAVNALQEQGRPALSRAIGTNHIDRVFITVDSPWQDTRVESKLIQNSTPFMFSREILMRAVKERTPLPQGKKELQIQVTATLLNGYQTNDPYGKRAERAEILMLSSAMDGDTMSLVAGAGKRLHARQGVLISPLQSLAHEVLRAQYPHDKDFLLMLVSDEATNLMFAKQGIVMDAASISVGLRRINLGRKETMRTLRVNEGPSRGEETTSATSEDAHWADAITDALKEIATRHALPRIVFLVTNDGSANALKRFLDTPSMHALWLSDESLTIIPVVSKLLSSLIRHQGAADADVMLDLVALFAKLKLTGK